MTELFTRTGGTVKDHGSYRDEAQTELTRVTGAA